jgi:hypothetical protein
MASVSEARGQAVTGVVPPQLAEAMIREVWPAVTSVPAAAKLGEKLIRSIILAPLGWLLLSPIYFRKVLPLLACRYTVTNRRVMVRRGLKPKPTSEVALSEIDDVRIVPESVNAFYRTATLEIIDRGKMVLQLVAVPEPESFRRAILEARNAWGSKRTPAAG